MLSVTPRIHRLPTEVLARIFGFFVYHPRLKKKSIHRLKAVYGHINTIGRVCKAWRDVVLGNSEFWVLIPVNREGRSPEEMTRICLQRAGRTRKLHLVAHFTLPHVRALRIRALFPKSIIAEYPHRIRTLNLTANRLLEITDAIDCLIEYCPPGSVEELSICFVAPDKDPRPTIFPHNSPQQVLLRKFLGSLCALRLSGISVYADGVAFSGLEELRLHEVDVLPRGALVRQLLPALAPRLRILHISCGRKGSRDTERPLGLNVHGSPISFPNLQALYLLNLSPHTMRALLHLIAPGSYRVIIHPTNLSLRVPGELPEALRLILQERNVSELSVDLYSWQTEELRLLLETLPSISTLHLHNVQLDRPGLVGLTSPPKSYLVRHCTNFPRLREVYLNNVCIEDQGAFKAMISSHPLERLHMVGDNRIADTYHAHPLQPAHELVVWLRSTISGFDLGCSSDGHPFPANGSENWDLCL